MTTTKIVWNGCDSYIESEFAESRNYDFSDGTLYHGADSFDEIDAVEISADDLPVDADGDIDFDGVMATETGNFYRLASTTGDTK